MRLMEEALSVVVSVWALAMISWMSRKQDHVALSSVEAKYVATCDVGKEVVWLRKLLLALFGKPLDPTVINCVNQSGIKLSEVPCQDEAYQ